MLQVGIEDLDTSGRITYERLPGTQQQPDGGRAVLPMRFRVLCVAPYFAPAWQYGGPVRTLFELCTHLAALGTRVRVLTTDALGLDRVLDVENEKEVEIEGGLKVRYCHTLLRHAVSPTLLRLLRESVSWADIVLLSSVYSFTSIPTLAACRILGKPVVWLPRGAFQRWHGTRRRTVKFLWECACHAVAPHDLILLLASETEREETLQRLPGMKTVVIPHGINAPRHIVRTPAGNQLRLLYLGRLQPQKGIENLIEACAILKGEQVPFKLIVAGGGRPQYLAIIKQKVNRLSLSSDIDFVGNVGPECKANLFAKTDVTIVPSFRESFCMVVLEALSHAVPVIVSQGAPWPEMENRGCGLWVKNDPASLAAAVKKIRNMPLRQMGEHGRQWVTSEFSWETTAVKTANLLLDLKARRC